jgi:hypothetical protein
VPVQGFTPEPGVGHVTEPVGGQAVDELSEHAQTGLEIAGVAPDGNSGVRSLTVALGCAIRYCAPARVAETSDAAPFMRAP